MSDCDGFAYSFAALIVAVSMVFTLCQMTMHTTAEQIVAASKVCAAANSTIQRVYVDGDVVCMNGMKGSPK